jgi:stress response protein YsnF
LSDAVDLKVDSTVESSGFEDIVIPLHVEEVSVSKRQVDTGRVQVSTVTHRHEELVDELLSRERVEIERVAMDQPVDAMPSIREEGDTIIVPVVEEVLVIERRLRLKEEVRIRRVSSTEKYQEKVMLRKQEAVVTRLPVDGTGATEPTGASGASSAVTQSQSHTNPKDFKEK